LKPTTRTDEARDSRDELYGFDRPIEVVRGIAHLSAETILKHLLEDWQNFVSDGAIEDDTTVLVMCRTDG